MLQFKISPAGEELLVHGQVRLKQRLGQLAADRVRHLRGRRRKPGIISTVRCWNRFQADGMLSREAVAAKDVLVQHAGDGELVADEIGQPHVLPLRAGTERLCCGAIKRTTVAARRRTWLQMESAAAEVKNQSRNCTISCLTAHDDRYSNWRDLRHRDVVGDSKADKEQGRTSKPCARRCSGTRPAATHPNLRSARAA